MMTTASPLELLHALVSTIGVAFCLWAIKRVREDRRWLLQNKQNGPRLWWVNHRLQHKVLLLLMQLLSLGMAVTSLFLAPPGPYETMTLQGELRTWTIILLSSGLALFTYRLWRDRGYLATHDWGKEERRQPPPRRAGDRYAPPR